jgi:hypothetical protein
MNDSRPRVLDVDSVVRDGLPALDVVLVPVFSDERPLRGIGALLDWNARGGLTRLLDRELVTGEPGDALLMPAPVPGFSRLVLVGLGAKDTLGREPERVAAQVVRVARDLRPDSLACDLPYGRAAGEVCDAYTRTLVAGLVEADVNAWLVVPLDAVTRTQRAVSGPLRTATEEAC